MQKQVICSKEIELNEEKYVAYLKEVATKLAVGSAIEGTTIRPFIRKARD